MSQSQLLQGEHNVMSSNDGSLILTNFRVKHESTNGGGSAYKSIPLKKISACALTTKKYPFLLVLAGLTVLGGATSPNDNLRIAAFVLAAIFILLYFLARNGQLEVFSDSGTSIVLPTSGLTHAQVRVFAEAVAQEIYKA